MRCPLLTQSGHERLRFAAVQYGMQGRVPELN
jgi:hypothetical protein